MPVSRAAALRANARAKLGTKAFRSRAARCSRAPCGPRLTGGRDCCASISLSRCSRGSRWGWPSRSCSTVRDAAACGFSNGLLSRHGGAPPYCDYSCEEQNRRPAPRTCSRGCAAVPRYSHRRNPLLERVARSHRAESRLVYHRVRQRGGEYIRREPRGIDFDVRNGLPKMSRKQAGLSRDFQRAPWASRVAVTARTRTFPSVARRRRRCGRVRGRLGQLRDVPDDRWTDTPRGCG